MIINESIDLQLNELGIIDNYSRAKFQKFIKDSFQEFFTKTESEKTLLIHEFKVNRRRYHFSIYTLRKGI